MALAFFNANALSYELRTTWVSGRDVGLGLRFVPIPLRLYISPFLSSPILVARWGIYWVHNDLFFKLVGDHFVPNSLAYIKALTALSLFFLSFFLNSSHTTLHFLLSFFIFFSHKFQLICIGFNERQIRLFFILLV